MHTLKSPKPKGQFSSPLHHVLAPSNRKLCVRTETIFWAGGAESRAQLKGEERPALGQASVWLGNGNHLRTHMKYSSSAGTDMLVGQVHSTKTRFLFLVILLKYFLLSSMQKILYLILSINILNFLTLLFYNYIFSFVERSLRLHLYPLLCFFP